MSEVSYMVEGYHWHDLRKDPDDLPEAWATVLICGKTYNIGFVTPEGPWCRGDFERECEYTSEDIVAWKYIEPFEVEE